jgi:hypothetical protein
MRRPLTENRNLNTRRGPRRTAIVCTVTAAELDDAQFRELAYRFVRCTDPAEHEHLKREILHRVLRRPGL